MNSITNQNSMHEMLFEKRNKDYGAYVIRATYNDAVIKALATVASTLLLFLGSAYAYNNYFAERPVMKEKVWEIEEKVVEMNLEPLEMKKPEAITQPASSERVDGLATIIRDNPEVPENPNTSLSVVSTPEVIGDSSNTEPIQGIAGTGTGTDVIKVEETIEKPFVIVEEMPEYPGGTKAMMEFFSKNIVYPERSKALGNEGTVFVNFVVGKDGKIASFKVLKGVDEDCNAEALRVVAKMPVWKPGKNSGREVPVMFNLPIRFKLN